jgi:hypothetical protein
VQCGYVLYAQQPEMQSHDHDLPRVFVLRVVGFGQLDGLAGDLEEFCCWEVLQ